MLPTMRYTERDTTPRLAENVGRFVVYQGKLAHVVQVLCATAAQPGRVLLRVRPGEATHQQMHELLGRPAQSAVYCGRGMYIKLLDFETWAERVVPADGL